MLRRGGQFGVSARPSARGTLRGVGPQPPQPAPDHLDALLAAAGLLRPEMGVAIPTFLFALWTQSLGGTVVVGMLLFWLQGKFF